MADASKSDLETNVFDDILTKLESNEYYEQIKTHLYSISNATENVKDIDLAERFLSWAKSDSNLKVVSVDVPSRILPNDYEGKLHDVKVFVKFGPDDSVYDNNKDIRERIARGNSFLELTNKVARTFCVLQAMKKFTGGLGDDDDRESGDDLIWQKYFTKPLEETDIVIATNKANGEAAHLSCIEIDGQFILCGGSKNVHLLFRNKSDIDRYVEPRYRIATEVCHTVMEALDEMTEEDRHRLMNFLVTSHYTAVFEILSPHHQHVVNLSHLKRPALKFISWTKCELEASEKLHHLNIVPPHVGIEIAKCLGLDPVTYEKVQVTELDLFMKQIRKGFDSEGKVLYFLDSDGQVIGLLKKKTTWYIMCRAVREKVKTAVNQSIKNPQKYSKGRSLNQIEKRIGEIQKWLHLDNATVTSWKELGTNCLKWVLHEVDDGKLSPEEVRDMFPVYWDRFLQETGATDRIIVEEDRLAECGACGGDT
ncbi:uncharacterized protein LOC123549145 isoform X1 [Mercenaria mercenaria]|uniref:uncharacterized protein LOC123549145 isoform X1 n=1 Tax=Mercenaria mercenaria TaxID=6596 RepID=UPI00234E92EB|nr:uncharacterized protein LOC123549145 isoform X1 [Mercenaria mercenaria]